MVLIKSDVSKIVYDVISDPDAAKSSTLNMLNKMLFVSIDRTSNQIEVFGEKKGFVILLNWKKSNKW